jgi:hypothetical protein
MRFVTRSTANIRISQFDVGRYICNESDLLKYDEYQFELLSRFWIITELVECRKIQIIVCKTKVHIKVLYDTLPSSDCVRHYCLGALIDR